jgi:release factor glutamine methyltransferase
VSPETPEPLPDVRAALQWARRQLQRAGRADEFPSAQTLLARAIAQPLAIILAHPEQQIPVPAANAYQSWIGRLGAGEPLPYISGEQEFYGLLFEVTPETLIPRPETELLVERAIALLSAQPRRVADVGTGLGCIAVAIASHCPYARFIATDLSEAALAVARRNVARHGLADRITLLQTDLLANAPGPFDLVCANLPYIPTATLRELPIAKHEPWSALDGGPDGLRFIERLLEQAASRMAPHGMLLLEIESTLGMTTAELAAKYFPAAGIVLHKDYSSLDRLVEIGPLS